MGAIRSQSPPAFLIFAIFSKHDSLLEEIVQELQDKFGPLPLRSEKFPFDQTAYYARQMGNGIQKQFLAGSTFFDIGTLAEVKRATNLIEEKVAQSGRFDVERPINIDPGYVDLGKLILASTKDHAHRVYLNDGIFAEVTLWIKDSAWQFWPWTYPDYKQHVATDFFLTVREQLFREVKKARQG